MCTLCGEVKDWPQPTARCPTCQPRYTCPTCHRTSYHPMDIKWSYCGYCHVFNDVNGELFK